MNLNRTAVLLGAVALVASGCKDSEPRRIEEVNFSELTTACACLDAATVVFDHASDLVLEIKRVSDESRKRINLGEAPSDAAVDSMLMLSEQLRASLDGPGRELDASCAELVDFDAVAHGESDPDCPRTEEFKAAHLRLEAIRNGVMQ